MESSSQDLSNGTKVAFQLPNSFPVLTSVVFGICSARKICLKGQSAEHLTGLMTHCEEVGLPFHLVEDAGLTQIPSGSLTVLAVFGPESQVNVVTGSLPLL